MSVLALVDDDEGVLEAVALFLRHRFTEKIVTYSNPCHLVTDLESGFRPDLIITDFHMPEMNGVELLDRAGQLHGKVPGIVISGYPECAENASSQNYPVLCKGDSDFFKSLIGWIDTNLVAVRDESIQETGGSHLGLRCL